MTETNTVSDGKTQQGPFLCKQNRNRWDLRIWRVGSLQYGEVVDFQYCAHIVEGKQDIEVQWLCYWKNLMERDRDSSPEALHWFDRQLHRENVSQHLKPCNFNKTFRIYQHISPLLFMRKLAFGSTWHSHQSCMIFTRIPWTSFACEEQSCLLFHKIISIRPCCWLRSLWKSVKVGHYKKKRQV